MDKQLIIEELNKRGVPIPSLENQNQNQNQNQNVDKTLIIEELKKRKGFEWMSEEEIIGKSKELIGTVTEPLKEYATEEIEKGRETWETEMGKIDPVEMGQVETYLKSPEFKRLALEVTGGVVGSLVAPQIAGPVALSKAITIARPALQQLVTRMIGAGVGEGFAGGVSQFFDPRESVVKEVLRAATQGIAGEGLGAVINKAIAKALGKNKKLIEGAEEAVETIAKQKEKIIKFPDSYSKRVQEAARTGNLTPALLQEGQTLDILENVAELSLIGSGGIRFTREGAETVAQSGIDDFVKQFKVVADDVEMGNLFQKLLKKDLDVFKKVSGVNYRAVDKKLASDKFADNFQVDLTTIKKWARNEIKNLGAKSESKPLKSFLDGILKENNYITFKRANNLRGDYLEISRAFTAEGLGKKRNRLSAIASKEITEAMDGAAVPDSVKELLANANKFYREGAEVFNTKLFSKIIESDPEIVYKSIVASGDRPSLMKRTLEIINKRIKDPTKKANLINAIRGQFLEDALSKSSKTVSQYGTQLDASKLNTFLSKKNMFLKELFTPEQITNLKKFQSALSFSQGVLKKKGGLPGAIFIQMKQSGAIMALAGGGYATGGAYGVAGALLLGPAALAKAFTNPKIIKALTLGFKYNQNPSVAGRYFYQAVTQMAGEGIITQDEADEIRKDMNENGYKVK
jgi:hypothetical protein